MLDVGTLVAIVFGLLGAATGILSLVIQSRQTEIMEAGLERAFEDGSAEGDTGTTREKRVRELINRRLADVRYQMRQEFAPRLTGVEERLKDGSYQTLVGLLLEIRSRQEFATSEIAKSTQEVSADVKRFEEEIAANIQRFLEEAERAKGAIATSEQRILAESGKYDNDIAAHSREIEALEQQVEVIRVTASSQEQTRMIMRLIGEQLLRLAN